MNVEILLSPWWELKDKLKRMNARESKRPDLWPSESFNTDLERNPLHPLTCVSVAKIIPSHLYGVSLCVSEPPTIELDFRDKIIIRVGESCLLQGRYTGKPPPSIAWYRDDEEVKADKHVMFKSTVATMSLGLMKAQREHSGRYVVVVENSTGSRKGVCKVTVVGA